MLAANNKYFKISQHKIGKASMTQQPGQRAENKSSFYLNI